MQAALEHFRVPVEGGEMHVEAQGAGEPVLLVHGIFASGYCWRHVASALARQYRVYTVDLLGFGQSDMHPEIDYSQSVQARRLHQLIESLGLQNVRLVGHSMGGEISMLAVLENATPFRQLVLVSADGFRPPFKRWQRTLLSGAWIAWFVRHRFNEKYFGRSTWLTVSDRHLFTEEMVSAYCAPYHRAEFPEAVRRIVETREGGIAPERCREIELPTLLLWGENDRVVPRRIGDQYHEHLPHAEYRLRPACGHMPMEEQPEWVIDELFRFFSA
jgi:pimeloyl-ACP methyl ester carboxylesterase